MASGLFLLLLCYVVALAVVVTVIIMRLRQGRVKSASCGKCHYSVEGLTALTCPECGSDLRAAGILTPSGRRVGAVLWIALWTLLLPVPATVINTLAADVVPLNWSTSLVIQVQADSPGYTSAAIELTGEDVRAPDIYQFAVVSLARNGQWLGNPLAIDLDRGSYSTSVNDEPMDGDRIDATVFAEWMASTTSKAAYTLEHEEALLVADTFKDDAAALLATIDSVRQGRAVPDVTGVQGRITEQSAFGAPPRWFRPVALGFWIALWIGGIMFIVKRSRRKAAIENNTSMALD